MLRREGRRLRREGWKERLRRDNQLRMEEKMESSGRMSKADGC